MKSFFNKKSKNNEIPISTAQTVIDDFKKNGVAKLSNIPPANETLLNIANQLGGLELDINPAFSGPPVIDIKHEPNKIKQASHPAYHTADTFPLHTDLSFVENPARLLLVYCVKKSSCKGGLTILANSEKAFNKLSPKDQQTLSSPIFKFKYPPGCPTSHCQSLPIHDTHNNKSIWRYNKSTMLYPSDAQKALKKFDSWLEHYQVELTVEEGELLIIDNHKMVHGRTAFNTNTKNQKRHLKRIFVNDLHENLTQNTPSTMKHILCIKGLQKNNWLQVILTEEQNILYKLTGSANIAQNINHPKLSREELILSGIDENNAYSLQRIPDLIFNEISDPDSHETALKSATVACNAFSEQYSCPIINHPEAIKKSSRDLVFKQLKDIQNLIIPKTIRCKSPQTPQQIFNAAEENKLKYPLLIRQTGTHLGETLTKLENNTDITPFYPLALNGQDFYLTEFIDYKNEDNYYRKYRFVVINGVPYIKHLIIHTSWMIHAKDRQTMEEDTKLIDEEQNLLDNFETILKPKLEPITQRIYKKLNLEFFGIDGTITRNNKLIIFEANANMNVFYTESPDNRWKETREKIECAMLQLITDKLQLPKTTITQAAA